MLERTGGIWPWGPGYLLTIPSGRRSQPIPPQPTDWEALCKEESIPGCSVMGVGNRLLSPTSQTLTALHPQTFPAGVHLTSINLTGTVNEIGKQECNLTGDRPYQ